MNGCCIGLTAFRCISFIRLVFQHLLQNLILYALQGSGLDKRFSIEGYIIALVNLNSQLNRRDRRQTCISQNSGDAKLFILDNVCNQLVKFCFKYVHRNIRLLNNCSFPLRFRQCPFVHFLILIQWNSIDLHGHCRYHVRRFLIENELVQSIYVDGLVADNIGSYEFPATFFIKSLHRSILDVREFTDDGLYFFQFDTESADLHLSVTPTYKLDVSIGKVTHDVTSAVDAVVFTRCLRRDEWIGNIDLLCLLRPIQIPLAYLWSGHP